MTDRQLDDLRLPISERLAINACAEVTAQQILCTSVGRAQTAAALAQSLPQARVSCLFLDLFPAEDSAELTETLPNLSILCAPDLPDEPADLFVMPVNRSGEAELTRELLQQGYDRLVIGGRLIATVDNPEDTWLHHEIEKLGKNLDRTPKRHGVVYRLKKLKPLKRLRDFSKTFPFRDGERLVQLVTRPGVFSHRRLDLGARALLECLHVEPEMRVLEIGCGSGAVGLAAALRAPGVHVHAIDSNARAIESVQRGAELNGITTLTFRQTAEGDLRWGSDDLSGTFDLAVGNPPYFSNYQIAELFLQTALRGLKPGGRVQIVSRQTEWLIARMEQLFTAIESEQKRGYHVVSGVRP